MPITTPATFQSSPSPKAGCYRTQYTTIGHPELQADATPTGPLCLICKAALIPMASIDRAWQCIASGTDHYAAVWFDWELSDPPLDRATARRLILQRMAEVER